jgi:hypothetical protein
MTTLDLQVAASADDAHEQNDGTNFSSTGIRVRCTGHTTNNNRYNGGARFTNVTVPPGATIDTAYLTIVAPTEDDPNVDIYGNDVDNAADFSTEADVTSRVLTTATVQWTASNIGTATPVNSPELKTVIQEIVDRAGWSSGNAMAIMMRGRNDAISDFRVTSYDDDPADAVKLHIEYTAGGGADAMPMAMDTYRRRRVAT